MTEQEAMEVIMQVAADRKFPRNSKKAFNIAYKCIEKQIPKKVDLVETATSKNCHCPSCDHYIGSKKEFRLSPLYRELNSFCRNCGQALDWGLR